MTTSSTGTLTKVKEFERVTIAFRNFEILPDQLQTRASINKSVCKIYSRRMADGSVFPPVLLFRLPDKRLVLADGFHRVEAARSLGLRSITAVIRPGTMEEAILEAIQCNLDLDVAEERDLTENDREHAVKVMLRNEVFRTWSNTEIARRCGVHKEKIVRARAMLLSKEGIPIPDRVLQFREGHCTGVTRPYKVALTLDDRINAPIPNLRRKRRQMSLLGKVIYLPADPVKAKEKRDSILNDIKTHIVNIADCKKLFHWLINRGIHSEPLALSRGALRIRDCALTAGGDMSVDTIYREIGRLVIVRQEIPDLTRSIVVGNFLPPMSPASWMIITMARQLPQPIEFLTPQEVVAEFGPKEGEATS